MAKSMNYVALLGRLTRDPEQKTTSSGKTLVRFTLAVGRTKEEQADFIDVTAWDKLGELIAQYLKKGGRAIVQGKLRQDTWEDKETGKKQSRVGVVATDIMFLDKPENPAAGVGSTEAEKQDLLSEIPF